MLRRSESIASILKRNDNEAAGVEAPPPEDIDFERRQAPRVRMNTPEMEAEATEPLQLDRRMNERRGSQRQSLESLRAEMLRNLVTEAEGNRGGFRFGLPQLARLRPARVALLLVALLSGGMAAYLVTQQSPETAASITQSITEIIEEPRAQILVANAAIGVGQKLSTASLAWEDWPEGSVRSEYITIAAQPDAISNMDNALARFEIFPGEPIREQKLARTDEGYLSAVLVSGKRGVSVAIDAESASGGFIVPNDHVDVVATRVNDLVQDSQTILRNVRVLAINKRLGENGATGTEPEVSEDPRDQMFANDAIATLELDQVQAELIISAAMGGSLTLVLRSLTDFTKVEEAAFSPTNAAIRASSRFWQE